MAYTQIDFQGADADNLPAAASKINDNFSKSFVDEGGMLTGAAGNLTIDMDADTLQFGSQLLTNPDFTSDASGWTLGNGAYWESGKVCLPRGCIGTVSVAAGGSGYSVDNVLTLADGTNGTVTVTSVGGSGEVTGVDVTTVGRGYTCAVHATTGGGGSGCTIEVLTRISSYVEQDPSFEVDDAYFLEITVGSDSSSCYHTMQAAGLASISWTYFTPSLVLERYWIASSTLSLKISAVDQTETDIATIESIKLWKVTQFPGQCLVYDDGTYDQFVINVGSGDLGQVYIGPDALSKGAFANGVVAIGKNALKVLTASNADPSNLNANVAIGMFAGENTNISQANVFIGTKAAQNWTSYKGQAVIIGYCAGQDGGADSVIIGNQAGVGVASHNTIIGRSAGASAGNVDSCIYLGYTAGYNRSTDKEFVVSYNSTTNFLLGKMDLTGTTGYLRVRGNVEPETDDTYDLGSGSYRWDDIYATNDIIQTSDERKKTDIADIGVGLDFIKALRPIQFKWADYSYETVVPDEDAPLDPELDLHPPKTITVDKTFTRRHFGFSAQEVKAVLDAKSISTTDFAPYCETANGDLGLRKSELIPILVKAIQELAARIEALESA